MTERKLTRVPDAPERMLPFGKLVTDKTVSGKKSRSGRANREPQMRALRRILGDGIMGIFPEELMKSVDAAHEFWQTNGDDFLVTDFDTVQDKEDSVTVMRAYAECAQDNGYSVYTRSDDDPLRLVWKVAKRREFTDTAAEAPAAEPPAEAAAESDDTIPGA